MLKNKNTKKLHIVAFDVPYPPNYGGVIDVFYKLKSLSQLGVEITLHTYEYGRGHVIELEKYCNKVHYYKRKKPYTDLFSRKPFIVKTRSSKKLMNRLLLDKNPILFEGLHTTFPLSFASFPERTILVRTHNIEHRYYDGLSKSDTRKRKKAFFKTESKKLERYEAVLEKADHLLTISPYEHEYFKQKYGARAIYIPAFFENKSLPLLETKEKFALWHGDLNVSDNRKALYKSIAMFKKTRHKLVVASSSIDPEILAAIAGHASIYFEKIESNEALEILFQKAHIHILITFQKTGIKLRLLHCLTKGKFVIANTKMIEDTGLESACLLANTDAEFKKGIERLFSLDFDNSHVELRKKLLAQFNPLHNAKEIKKLL